MRCDMAAAYVDEKSVYTFLRNVGSVHPHPIRGAGRRGFWAKTDLDAAPFAGTTVSDDLAELI